MKIKLFFVLLFCIFLISCSKPSYNKILDNPELKEEWEEFYQNTNLKMLDNKTQLKVNYFSSEFNQPTYVFSTFWSKSLYISDEENLIKEIILEEELPIKVNSIGVSKENKIWVLFADIRKNDIMRVLGSWIWVIDPKEDKIEKKLGLEELKNPEYICFGERYAYIGTRNNGFYFGIVKIDLEDYSVILEKEFESTGFMNDFSCDEKGIFILTDNVLYGINKKDLSYSKLIQDIEAYDFYHDEKEGIIYINNLIGEDEYQVIIYDVEKKETNKLDLPSKLKASEIIKLENNLLISSYDAIAIINLVDGKIISKELPLSYSMFPSYKQKLILGDLIYNFETGDVIKIKNLPKLDWDSVEKIKIS